jgi:hypothetical protein
MPGENDQIALDLGDSVEVEKEPEVVLLAENEPEPEPEKPVKAAVEPDAAIEELNRRLGAERQAREEAERFAREATNRANQAANEVEDTHLHLVKNAIDTVRRDQEILKANLKECWTIGDYDKAAEIQEAMSGNSAKLLQLEHGFQEMQNRPRSEPVRPAPPSQQQGPDVDDLIQRVTPLSAQWLQNNRESLKNPRSFRIMARAHEDAVDHGIVPESDDYFRFVESRLGINREAEAPVEPAMSTAAAPVQRRQSPPAAPVSRQPSNSSGNKPHVVKLTPEQREAARISGITEEEYARQMLKERNRVH